ncbi:MAG: hypothetical protein IBJ10_00375 [Phycisphaerales bacterium]|nr:hypothetical protein [Phycisphaerales bacterium]
MADAYSITSVRTLAPEDVAPGQFVAAVYRVYERPAGSCYDDSIASREVGVLRCRLKADDGPYRVLEVCLPFVLVEDQHGDKSQIDTRDTTLARLSDAYGQRAFAKSRDDAPDLTDFQKLRAEALRHIGVE